VNPLDVVYIATIAGILSAVIWTVVVLGLLPGE
jgi:hypothetical protein